MGLSLAIAVSAGAYTDARVNEITGWLPERPAAPGARIGDRAAWGRLAALPSAARHIRAAEKALAEPIPELTDDLYMEFSRSGNRSRYRKLYDMRYFALANLLLGECLENKGRFLPAIVARIEAICSERSWNYPAHDKQLLSFNGSPHVDVGSARLTAYLSLAYDWLRDVLPPETKARLLAECDRRSFQPYLATCRNFSPKDSVMARRNWWYHAENNWNSACNSGVVRAALAMVEDRRLRAEFVAAAEEAVPYAMRGYLSDGYCTEGMGYWNYGYGNLLMMGLAVRGATGGKVDFFADPKHRAVMAFPYRNRLMGWKSPHFADYAADPSIPLLALESQVFPDLTCRAVDALDPLADDGGWPHSHLTEVALRAFGQMPSAGARPGLDALPPRDWFPEGQVFIARGEWPARTMRLAIAIKGGHNGELHNHNDVGSYMVMLDGDEMCGDPGPEVYRAQTFSKDRYLSKVLNSYGHPVPVVGGRLQETGPSAAAKIVRTGFTDDRDEIVIDLTAAYSVPTLRSLVRTMSFDRVNATISITDAATFSEPTAFEVPVITYRAYEKSADATHFALRKKKGLRTLGMDVRASAPVTFRDETIENKPRPDVTRLAFSFAQPVTNATLTIKYIPSHFPRPAPATSGAAAAGRARRPAEPPQPN